MLGTVLQIAQIEILLYKGSFRGAPIDPMLYKALQRLIQQKAATLAMVAMG